MLKARPKGGVFGETDVPKDLVWTSPRWQVIQKLMGEIWRIYTSK
jgi:hypothetical protein